MSVTVIPPTTLDFTKLTVPAVIKTTSGKYFYMKIRQKPATADPKLKVVALGVNKLLRQVAIQPTLGAMLKVAGVENYKRQGFNIESWAVQSILVDMRDSGFLTEAAYRTLWYALEGYPDATLWPGGGASAVATGLLAMIPLVGWVAAGAKFAYDMQKKTLQDMTKKTMTIEQALQEFAKWDAPAADLLADVIAERQVIFQEQYMDNFLNKIGAAVWKGLKRLIVIVIEGTKAALQWAAETAEALIAGAVDIAASIIPWYVKVGIVGGLGLFAYLAYQNRKVIGAATVGAMAGGPAGAAMAMAMAAQQPQQPRQTLPTQQNPRRLRTR